MEDHRKVQVDFRSGITPFSLMKVVRLLHGMSAGDVLEVQGNDPEMQQGLFQVLAPESYDLLGIVQEEERFRIRLRKA